MKTKNISINLKEDEKIPIKETYIVFYIHEEKIKIEQKFADQGKNQSITLNQAECERMMNLIAYFLLDGKFVLKKDKMLKFKEK